MYLGVFLYFSGSPKQRIATVSKVSRADEASLNESLETVDNNFTVSDSADSDEAFVASIRAALPPSASNDALLTNAMCRRFLVAREGSIPAAVAMYERWVAFRIEYNLDDIKPEETKNIRDKNLAYWRDSDNKNRPACIVVPRRKGQHCTI